MEDGVTWDLQTIFRLHARRVRSRLHRYGIGAELAEDLTQDTFLRLLRHAPPEGTVSAEVGPYLHRISRNLLIDHWRREGRSPFVPLSAQEAERIADPAPTPETICHDRQRLQIVTAALSELPERTRRAFELHRLHGQPIAAVAAQIGVSPTRAWTLIHAAYRHLRDRLRESGSE